MDPHFVPELQGSSRELSREPSPEPTKSADGASYLSRLKKELAPQTSAVVPGRAPEPKQVFEFEERRQSPRLRCSGSVEFRLAGDTVRMWGTLTDISLHGCYVEMSNTFPVNTQVYLVLKSCGRILNAAGTVRASYPGLGMGICFSNIEPEHQVQLRALLELLSGHGTSLASGSSQQNRLRKNLTGSASPKSLFDELTKFFETRQLLSRAEFQEIAKRTRSS